MSMNKKENNKTVRSRLYTSVLLVLLALLLCFVMFSFCSRILKLCYKPVGNPLPMPSLRIHLGLTWCGLLLIAGASVLGIVQPPFLIKFINAVIAF